MPPRAIALAVLALTFAASAHARAEGGHAVNLLSDGRASFAERARNIRDADVIFYKSYLFAGDKTGDATVAMLADRARGGAKVFVEYDARGTLGNALKQLSVAYLKTSPIPEYLRPLVDAGVTLLPVNVPTMKRTFLGSDHEKLLVTWKRGEAARAIVGGMNIGDEWANGGYTHDAPKTTGHLDTDLEITGPQVGFVVDRFIDAARRQKMSIDSVSQIAAEMKRAPETYAAQPGDAHVHFYVNDPKEGPNPRNLERLYARLLSSTPAGETVTISNPYLVPSQSLRDELISAGNRGVKIRMLVNDEHEPEMAARLTAHALRADLRTLFKKIPAGNLEVYEWSGNKTRNEGSIHEKIASFGKTGPVLVGSFNLDSLSANTNSEEATLVENAHVRRQFDRAMDRSIRAATPLTAQALGAQPIWRKAEQRVIRTVLGRVL